MISSSFAPLANVSSKGYKSTITKSISGISCCCICAISLSNSLRPKIPPKILGCNVLTLPPNISGKEVNPSTDFTGIPRFSINACVPPVLYNITPKSCNFLMIGSKLSL